MRTGLSGPGVGITIGAASCCWTIGRRWAGISFRLNCAPPAVVGGVWPPGSTIRLRLISGVTVGVGRLANAAACASAWTAAVSRCRVCRAWNNSTPMITSPTIARISTSSSSRFQIVFALADGVPPGAAASRGNSSSKRGVPSPSRGETAAVARAGGSTSAAGVLGGGSSCAGVAAAVGPGSGADPSGADLRAGRVRRPSSARRRRRSCRASRLRIARMRSSSSMDSSSTGRLSRIVSQSLRLFSRRQRRPPAGRTSGTAADRRAAGATGPAGYTPSAGAGCPARPARQSPPNPGRGAG